MMLPSRSMIPPTVLAMLSGLMSAMSMAAPRRCRRKETGRLLVRVARFRFRGSERRCFARCLAQLRLRRHGPGEDVLIRDGVGGFKRAFVALPDEVSFGSENVR